jgi:hypothetical protein
MAKIQCQAKKIPSVGMLQCSTSLARVRYGASVFEDAPFWGGRLLKVLPLSALNCLVEIQLQFHVLGFQAHLATVIFGSYKRAMEDVFR